MLWRSFRFTGTRSLVALFVIAPLIAGIAAGAFALDRHPAQASSVIETITIEPANPTEADSITITVSGYMAAKCYDDISSSHSLTENVISITIDAIPGTGFCPFALGVPYSVTENIGGLPAGDYQVDATVYEPFPLDCGSPPCSASANFGVGPVPPVGGVAELPDVAQTPLETTDSTGLRAGVWGAAGAIAVTGASMLGGMAWRLRKRRVER